jgi:mannosylglucosylglycerate synthase
MCPYTTSKRGESMNVCILHYSAPPVVGGVERVIRAHTMLLLTGGHKVTILAGRGRTFDKRAPVKLIPLLDSKNTDILHVGGELAAGVVSAQFRQLQQAIREELREHLASADLCLAHNVLSLHKNLPLTSALWHLAEDGGTAPLIAMCHDLAWTNPQYLPSLHEGEPWSLLKQPAPGVRYVTGSEERIEQFAKLWSTAKPQVLLLPSGVDGPSLLRLSPAGHRLAERLDLWEQDLLLLLPARLTRRKNIELAIRITASLVARGIKVRLVVTGPPGPHNVTNAAYVRDLDDLRHVVGVEKEVVLLYLDGDSGRPMRVSDRVVADLYALSDALLFPSRQEGFGLPVIEAGLARLPVFCSDIPPSRALACDSGHYFGLDASPHDAADMIERWMHTDPGYRLRRRVYRSYTWRAVYANHIEPLLRQMQQETEQRMAA